MVKKLFVFPIILSFGFMTSFCAVLSRPDRTDQVVTPNESSLPTEYDPYPVEDDQFPEPGKSDLHQSNKGDNRLTPDQFIYLGAFRLPPEFDWGARGITYFPGGNNEKGSLFVTGFEAEPALVGEVTIPSPVLDPDPLKLPLAEILLVPRSFDGSIIETELDPSTTFAGDIEFIPKRGTQQTDKIYGSVDWWYAVMDFDFPTIWFSEMDGSNPRGLFHVGEEIPPFHGNRTGDYLFTVPQWYADQYLGGRVMVTGKSRGTENGSQGPSLFAFQPWEVEEPQGDLDSIPILWYRFIYPECAGPNVGDKNACDYPGFTMCDKWLGGSFVEQGDQKAILLYGVKGLGENGYGPPPSEDSCNPYQGYHCDPLERQIIFYDVDELGQAAQGLRDPWTIVPYQIWRPGEFYLGDMDGHTCGETGGMALDTINHRLFIVEKGLGENNSAVVHIWMIN